MRLQMDGHKFELILEGCVESYDFESGEYGFFLRTKSRWVGVGVVRSVDSQDTHTFSFCTEYGCSGNDFKQDILSTNYLCWGRSISQLDVLDEKKVADWLAEKILKMKGEEKITLPNLDTKELAWIGAIFDSEGQSYLEV